MRVIGVIPARMNSSRFPGKPMAMIGKYPMIGHVYLRSKLSKLSEVYVATCDKEVYDYITSIGGKAIMTGDHHERASDRVAEALDKIEKAEGVKADVVVMIQGDEPMVYPDMIDEAVGPLIMDRDVVVSNLLGHIDDDAEFNDPNSIKVVVDRSLDALYFSREPIPTVKRGLTGAKAQRGKQVCIIPFRRDFLLKYTKLEPTPLEIAESVDMLRVLEHGYKVRMVPTNRRTYSVDTPEDLKRVENAMKKDELQGKY